MKKLKGLSLVILVFMVVNLLSATVVMAEDLSNTTNQVEFLENGSFETIKEDGKPDGWSLSSSTVVGTNLDVSDNAKTGTKSIKMYGNRRVRHFCHRRSDMQNQKKVIIFPHNSRLFRLLLQADQEVRKWI